MSQEEDLFGLFDSELNFEDEVAEERRKKKASVKQIEELCTFIGGFEKWPQLIEDCKRKVVEFLDYKTRFSLAVCSREDNRIVQKVPLLVHSVELVDNEKHHYQYQEEEFENVIVNVQFDDVPNSRFRFERIFSQRGEDTVVRWMRYFPRKRPEKKEAILKNCNYYQEAVKFGESWMKRGKFEMSRISVEMKNYPLESSEIKSFPKCTEIRVLSKDESVIRWWLQKVPEQLKDLQLLTGFDERMNVTLSRSLLSTPHVMNAEQFYFWARADFSDEQLLNLKALRMSFDAVSITDDGINEFVQRWVNGKGTPNFKDVLMWSEREYDQERILRGLTVRPWDRAFEEEARGFCFDFHRCCGRGTTFQIASKIDPYESLTLDISSDRVSIYHTGTRYTWNGNTYTSYCIP